MKESSTPAASRLTELSERPKRGTQVGLGADPALPLPLRLLGCPGLTACPLPRQDWLAEIDARRKAAVGSADRPPASRPGRSNLRQNGPAGTSMHPQRFPPIAETAVSAPPGSPSAWPGAASGAEPDGGAAPAGGDLPTASWLPRADSDVIGLTSTLVKRLSGQPPAAEDAAGRATVSYAQLRLSADWDPPRAGPPRQ